MECLPELISHQLYGEGVSKIALVADDLDEYENRSQFSAITSFHQEKELDMVQKTRNIDGVTALIYDQGCATEKEEKEWVN